MEPHIDLLEEMGRIGFSRKDVISKIEEIVILYGGGLTIEELFRPVNIGVRYGMNDMDTSNIIFQNFSQNQENALKKTV